MTTVHVCEEPAAAAAGQVHRKVKRLADNGTARSRSSAARMRRTTQSATQARTFQLGVFGKIMKWMNLSDTWAPEKASAETIKWLLHVLSHDASFKKNKNTKKTKTEIKQRGKHLRSTPPWSVSLKICLLSRCFLKAQEFVFVYKRPHLCLEKEKQWWFQEHVFHWRRIWNGRYRDAQLQTKHVCSVPHTPAVDIQDVK